MKRKAGKPAARRTRSGTPTPVESHFRAVFENSRDAIGISKGGVHVFVNPAYLQLFGFPPGTDLAGKPVLDLIAPSRRGQIADYIRRRVGGEEAPPSYETRALRDDGTEFDMEVTVSQYREGADTLTLAVLRDITARKATESALAEREMTLRQIMDTADVAIFLVDRTGRITHANRRMAQMFGCLPEELRGSEYVARVHPSEREVGRQKMLALLASSIPAVDLERLYWRKDGSEFWGHLAGRRFQDARGNEVGLIGVITDIDQRKRAEESQRAGEERYRRLYDRTPAMLHSIDHEGRLVSVSDEWLRKLGYSRDEVLGRRTMEFLTETSRNYARETVLPEFFRTGECREIPYQMVAKSGTILDVLLSATSERDEAGRVVRSLAIIEDVTERTQAERRLKDSESRLRTVTENVPDAILQVDRQGVITFVNHPIPGLSVSQVVGTTVYQWVPADAHEVVQRALQAAFTTGLRQEYETAGPGPAGQFRSFSVRVVPVVVEGRTESAIYIATDITERKTAEGTLRRSEARYRRLYNETPVMLHSIGRSGLLVDVNDHWLKTLGYARHEVVGRKVTDFYTEASKRYAEQEVQPAFFRDGEVTDVAYQFVKKSGEVVDVLLSASGERDEAGNVVRSQAVVEDVTERKRAERAIHETSELLTRFVRHSPIYAYIKEVTPGESRVLHVSENFERMIGIPASAMAGRTMAELFPPEFAAKITADDWAVVSGGKVLQQEEELGGRSYTTIKFPLELGGRTLLAGYTIDITERRQTEALQLESEARYRLLFESANDGIFITDESGFIDCNQRGAEMYGLTRERVFGRSPGEFAPERQPDGRLSSEVAAENTRAAIDGVPRQFEWRSLRADGTSFDVEITLSRFELGGKACLIAVVRDIGDRKRAERELLNAQRLESIGTLAGGIAHDFNNLLQGVFGYISMARIAHGQREKSLAMLEQAEKALHQAVGLTSQLLTFAKGGKPLKKVIPLRPVLEDAVKFALSGSRTVCELSLPDDLSRVDADAGQIGQVIQNIVLNADQAMPLGGRIALSARNVAAASVPGLPASLTGDLVEIAIRDEGTGIPPEHLARIFDPYFTTKDKGSGLGLATSYSIVNSHGGAISVASEFGKGSTFIIRLPAAALPSEQPQPHETPGSDRRLRVLVMDDEQIIRKVAGEILSALGHEAEFAENGEAAIAAYQGARAAGRPFDAVILDLTIRGGLGGVVTIRKLLEIDPAVKAVVSSGYSEDAGISSYFEHGFKQFLKKPYSVADLRRVLNSLA